MSLTEAQVGRAIALLRSRRSGSKYDRRRGRVIPGVRAFEDKDLRELFHLTPAQFNKALAAFEGTKPRSMSMPQMMDNVLAFFIKEGRWPVRKDYNEWRTNSLPTKDALYRTFSPRYDFVGNRGIVRNSLDVLLGRAIRQRWSKFTPQMILAIPNVTVRQEAMEKYGIEKLLRKAGGKPFQQDDFGKLWRLPSDNIRDPHAQWVEVINATPEKNGRKLHFFLRVPPEMNTAQEAVYWTFPDLSETGIPPDQYEFAQAS